MRLPAVRLTRDANPAGGDASAAPSGSLADLAGVHVLVVDDEDDGREMLATILCDSGAKIAQPTSAAAALSELRHHVPNLLISDIGMPKVYGYELASRVRALRRVEVNRIPAIALIAFARSDDAVMAREAGFIVHLPKPIDPSELLSTIVHLLDESRARGNA